MTVPVIEEPDVRKEQVGEADTKAEAWAKIKNFYIPRAKWMKQLRYEDEEVIITFRPERNARSATSGGTWKIMMYVEKVKGK